MPLHTFLSISEAARKLRAGDLSAIELVTECLNRIKQRERVVKAWVEVYEEQALTAAEKADEALCRGANVPPLHGIPIGVKDIVDVRGMWTRAGCAAFEAEVASADAVAVAQLRQAGAIVIGKTETTAFANNDPAPTCNPWNEEHTPGGSSSGSGAAVADGMCLAALGTQTGGSILRPAAYTGIVGLKPTYGTIRVDGVIPVSLTLDHVGPLTRTVADAKLMFELLRSPRPERYAPMVPADAYHEEALLSERLPRLGYLKRFSEQEADLDTIRHIEGVRQTIQRAGGTIVDLDCTDIFREAARFHRIIMDTELAEYHWDNYCRNKSPYPPKISERIEQGMRTSARDYIKALKFRLYYQKRLHEELADVHAVILPTAPSTAPKGLESTGSPIFCVPWSMAGFPAITIPSGLSDNGLPYGFQVVARPYQEQVLCAIATWCETLFQFHARTTRAQEGGANKIGDDLQPGIWRKSV